MHLTAAQTTAVILSVAAGAITTRFLPFVVFPEKREIPDFVLNLGKMLPPAMMGLLVVYCLKDVSVTSMPFGLPEFISLLIIIALHRWKGNVLLSIGGGTAVYMILRQTVFA